MCGGQRALLSESRSSSVGLHDLSEDVLVASVLYIESKCMPLSLDIMDTLVRSVLQLHHVLVADTVQLQEVVNY